MTDCCVHIRCKERVKRRTEFGGENGTYLRETKEEWVGPDIAKGREGMSMMPKLCLGA